MGMAASTVSVRAQEAPSGLAAVVAVERAVVAAIERAEPSVVAIARVRQPKPGEVSLLEPRFEPFRAKTTPINPPEPGDPDFIPTEFASGVVVDARGLVLTVAHLIVPDSEYYVTTSARKTHRAKVVAADPRSDLAVLSIASDDVKPIALGAGESLRKGQIVISLGNPFAVSRDGQPSASWGIVANLARKSPPLGKTQESSAGRTLHEFGTLIQTDARLNQTSDGGALIDLEGRLIGLSVAVAAVPGYESSGGYAMPVNDVFRRALDLLKQGKEVEFGFLGVRPNRLKSDQLVNGLQGIRVESVVAGSPAERAGLKPDDLITAVAQKPIQDADGLLLEVGSMAAGSSVELSVIRDRKPLQVPVALAKYPVSGRKIVTAPRPTWRGLDVDHTSVALSEESGSRVIADGVLVVAVREKSPAAKSGLQPGMVITRVGRKAVHSPADFWSAVQGQTGPITLQAAGRNGAGETKHEVAMDGQ